MPEYRYFRESPGAIASEINLLTVEHRAADWIQAVAGGQIVIRDGSGTSVTIANAAAGEVIPGPIRAIVSSAGKVRYGTGDAPVPAAVTGSAASAAQAAAETAETNAETAATTATTQAGIATTQAGIATTQAGIATTQAGIATAAATYTAANTSHWAGADPTTVKSAIDRIAAVLGDPTPIP